MKGGRSVSERRHLLKNWPVLFAFLIISGIVLDGLDDCGDLASKVGVAATGRIAG